MALNRAKSQDFMDMASNEWQVDDGPRSTPGRSIGMRIFCGVVLVFLAVLVLFVALDIRHESLMAAELGASPTRISAIRAQTLKLHLVHGAVTVVLFAGGIYFIVRHLVTRRVEAIGLAVRRFHLGSWSPTIPRESKDEIEWLAETFRQLGPHLEKTLVTFVETDRKATVARLGRLYETALTPPARRTLTLARSMVEREGESWAWLEVEQAAMRILAEMGRLGRPEHPALGQITRVRSAPQGERDGGKSGASESEQDAAAECSQSAIR